MRARHLITAIVLGGITWLLISTGSYRACGGRDDRVIDGWREQNGNWQFTVAAVGSHDLTSSPITPNSTVRFVLREPLSRHGTWYGSSGMSWVAFDDSFGRIDQQGVLTEAWLMDGLDAVLAERLVLFVDRTIVPASYSRRLPPTGADEYQWLNVQWTQSLGGIEIDQLAWTFLPGIIVAGLVFSVMTLVGRVKQVPAGCCTNCRYDLTGLQVSATCPECGRERI